MSIPAIRQETPEGRPLQHIPIGLPEEHKETLPQIEGHLDETSPLTPPPPFFPSFTSPKSSFNAGAL